MSKRFGGLLCSRLFLSMTALAGVAFAGAFPAHAALINVNTTNMAWLPRDGLCSLPEALANINSQSSKTDCHVADGQPYGQGDVIVVPAGTYVATSTQFIQTSVELHGAGVGVTIIRSNLSSGTELFNVQPPPEPGPDTFTSNVIFQDLTVDRASTQSAPIVTGIYGLATSNFSHLFLQLFRCRIAGHTFAGVRGEGVDLDINDSTIENNTSPWAGGGISSVNSGDIQTDGVLGQLYVRRSAITGNTSDEGGGGIYFGGGGLTGGNQNLENSTVSGNHSKVSGGGILNVITAQYLQLNSSTIAFNRADAFGGGVYSPPGPFNFYCGGTIVAKNTAGTSNDWDGYVTGIQDSLIGTTTGMIINNDDGNNLFNVDPRLDSTLRDLGGPNHTKVHKLLAGSPAFDRIPGGSNPMAVDQRGFPRNVDADGVGGAADDIGAYEHNPFWLETESLAVNAKSADTHTTVTNTGYSTTVGTNLQANAPADFVTYVVPVLLTGTYNVKVNVRKGNNRGIFQLAVSRSAGGPWTPVGLTQDLFISGTTQPFAELNVSNSASLTAGNMFFRFTVTGHNVGSSSYQLFLDYIKLTKL